MVKKIYTELFEYYSISKFDDKKNRRIRKVIRERLEKTFPSKEWDELTKLEKQRFKLVIMKDYLIKNSSKPEKIEAKIQADLEKTLLNANEALVEHNKDTEILFTQFYDASATDEEQHNSYLLFCKNFHKYIPSEIPPTFEEWKIHPLRLYDIQQNYLWNPDSYSQNQELHKSTPVTQAQIDHAVLECILLILERELKYKIDIASIKHCLNMTSNIDALNAVPLQAEIDPLSNVSVGEQEKIINKNIELMDAIQKLDEYDFIKKIVK